MIALNTFDAVQTAEEHHGSGAYSKRPLNIVRGEGTTLWDDAGNAYIDCTSGQGVALLGHSHPQLVNAIQAQAAELITCPEIFYNTQRAALYERLAQIIPGDINRFFLCNSGAEAIEGALKAAILFTGRHEIIATRRAFHGRTLGALSLTWNPKYREPFTAISNPAVSHINYNDLDAARAAINSDTAAVVVESVQGEGGVHPIEAAYLQGLRQICYEQGALLIIDEIQTGLGRTGRWFGFEHARTLPDIIALGKGLAGGLPMGAVCWRDSLGTLPPASHGSTFGGNPLACAAANATLSILEAERLPQQAAKNGAWLCQQLEALAHPQIREVRGIGLMVGIELRGRVTPVLKNLQERGVLALPAGMNVLRLLPPLTITRDELQIVIDAIGESLNA
jgi:acetylornithine/LysW-gamma-L-lysine aminotransferase